MALAAAQTDSHGRGTGGGVGSGVGTGLGEGDGAGIGPGSGGGTGGGPYRPGSGVEAPRLLREVRADYTEDARRRGIEGDVTLEIVVRRDGSLADHDEIVRLTHAAAGLTLVQSGGTEASELSELSRHLDEVLLIELCMLIGHYEMLAMTLNSLDVEPDFEARL